jgi:hypothetical protein
MSSSQLLLELLSLTSGISSLSNLQLLQISNSNSLFAFSPQLLQFSQSCGNSLNELEQLVDSPVNSLLLNLNGGNSQNACLEELLQLEQLFLSGNSNLDLNNNNGDNNNSNDLNLNNSTESSSNSTVSSSSANLNSSSADASNSSAAVAPPPAAAKGKGKDSAKKEGRSEIVQRSAGEKRRVLGGLGFMAFMLVGAVAL